MDRISANTGWNWFELFLWVRDQFDEGRFPCRASVLWHLGVTLWDVSTHADGQNHPQQLQQTGNSDKNTNGGKFSILQLLSATFI